MCDNAHEADKLKEKADVETPRLFPLTPFVKVETEEGEISFRLQSGELGHSGEREYVLLNQGFLPFGFLDEAGMDSAALENLNNPTVFIDRVKKSPDLILSDEPTRQTLRFLRFVCFSGNDVITKWAESILKSLKLGIFIPKRPTRRPESPWLLYWRLNPSHLAESVKGYEDKIRTFIDFRKTWKENKQELERAFLEIHKRPIPEGSLKKIQQKDIADFALLFISIRLEIPYSSLRRLYYVSQKR